MTTIPVKFVREHGTGLQASSIYLEGERLIFVNDEAAAQVESDTAFELYWRMVGNPGSTLTIKCVVSPTLTKVCVDKSKIPANRTRKSDFGFIKL